MSITSFLIGAGMTVCGVLLVKFTFAAVRITGRQFWLEKYTGSGTTYAMFKIFGVFLVIAGISFATGLGAMFLDMLFSPLKGLFSPTTPGAGIRGQ